MHDKEIYSWKMSELCATVMWYVQLSLYIYFLRDITSSPLGNFGIISFAFSKFNYCEILEETKTRPIIQFAFIS